jgi:putative transposase
VTARSTEYPADPLVILRDLPERQREEFLRQYHQAVDAAHDPADCQRLRHLLHVWSLTAIAARQPGYYEELAAAARGCQYTSAEFAGLAGDCQVVLSPGRKGQCWDNALAESFFSSLKGELTDHQAWPTRAGARRAIVEYIGWYNGTRLHSTLGYRSPAEFEVSARKEALQQVA